MSIRTLYAVCVRIYSSGYKNGITSPTTDMETQPLSCIDWYKDVRESGFGASTRGDKFDGTHLIHSRIYVRTSVSPRFLDADHCHCTTSSLHILSETR